MKKILLFIIPLLAIMSSCIKDEAVDCPSCKDKVCFTLQVQEEGVRYITRSTDEQTVRDVNLFLYDPRGVLPTRHFYVENSAVECSVLPGRYETYAVANVHRDMGTMTREQLIDEQLPSATNYETIPMSGHTTLTVEDRMPAPVITVRRAVAKIICNVSIASTVANTMKMQSIRIVNAAASTKLFEKEQVAPNFVEISSTALASSEARSATRIFYPLENCQGDIPSITTQQQKCAANAPQGATFVRIEAQQEGIHLIYNIYLGENNTSNFDVRRNTIQTLDICIKGKNEVDTRINSFGVTITDDFPDPYFRFYSRDYCWDAKDKTLTIAVEKPIATGNLSGEILHVQGQKPAFHVNGQALAPDCKIQLTESAESYKFDICYSPQVFTAANNRLIYDVFLSNDNGYSYTKRFMHDFYNHLIAYTYWSGRENTGGRIEEVSAVRYISHLEASAYYTRILALDGAQMSAISNDGFVFKGWYADKELTRKISDENPYRHAMTCTRDTLYTRFDRESVYIYTRIDDVTFTCPDGYRIDYDKQAFIVSPGSRCQISADENRPFVAWWNNFPGHLPHTTVSTNSTYTFTAWTNRKIVPEYETD